MLDTAEQARAAAFVARGDQTRFVVGAALLKSAVAHEQGVALTAIRVDRRCDSCGRQHGAPRIPDSDLYVSASHAGERVVVAITPTASVGIDVEERVLRMAMPPVSKVLTDVEPSHGVDDFLTYWCRKESVSKAKGVGLAVSMLDIIVSPANKPARLVSYEGVNAMAQMSDLDLGSQYVGAVTVLTGKTVSWHVSSAESLLRVESVDASSFYV
jgi:4'-phosphopantetheinyl transferase